MFDSVESGYSKTFCWTVWLTDRTSSARRLGLPDFTRRNTGDFCPSIHPSPVRPMCRYIIPRMLPSGHKLHTSSECYWNCNKIDINPSLCSASSTRLSAWHCLHLLLSTVLQPGLQRCCCRAPGAVDQYLLRVRHSAANPPHAAAAFDWWDRRTDTRPFYRPCSAYYARSVEKRVQLSNCRWSASLNFLRRCRVH